MERRRAAPTSSSARPWPFPRCPARSRPGQACERGGQRENARPPGRPGCRHGCDHLRLVAALLGVIDRSHPSGTRSAPDGGDREDPSCFTAACRTGDRFRRRAERPSHVEHAVFVASILVDGHSTPPSRESNNAGAQTPRERTGTSHDPPPGGNPRNHRRENDGPVNPARRAFPAGPIGSPGTHPKG